MSYDLVRNPAILRALLDMRWDHLILDEAHALKDPKINGRTEAVLRLTDVVGNITMATGTPMPNQPIEIYNAARLIDWEAIDYMSLEQFREYYYAKSGGYTVGPRLKKWTNPRTGAVQEVMRRERYYDPELRNQPQNLDELQERLRGSFMVRRLKEDVLTQLPDKQWHPFPLDITPGIRKALKHPGWDKVERMMDLGITEFDRSVEIDGEISTARRELGAAKAPGISAYCKDLMREMPKLVIGAWHKDVLRFLREDLEKFGVAYMDGSTSSAKKQSEVDRFVLDPKCGIMLGQLGPLGMGWTLIVASHGVLAEPDWVPGVNDQFLDRMHRIGQPDYVVGHIPIVPNSMDERVMGVAVGKDGNIYNALDSNNPRR